LVPGASTAAAIPSHARSGRSAFPPARSAWCRRRAGIMSVNRPFTFRRYTPMRAVAPHRLSPRRRRPT
jgi:hypothetical protein